MKRLALFVFFEKNGQLRDYVKFYLKELLKVSSSVIVIANGKLTPESRRKIEGLGCEVQVRENKGLDFAAWKYIILKKGWEFLSSFDELILCNCSCYGPLYSFSQLFEKMNKDPANSDFWGINRHPEIKGFYLVPYDKESEVIEHLQSHFLVFKKKLFLSEEFKNWWVNLKPAASYAEEVGYHETKFTRYLENAGFVSACLAFDDELRELKDNATFYRAIELIKNYNSPLVKRRVFSHPKISWLNQTMGYEPRRLLDFIQSDTQYDTEFIWEDLLNSQKPSTIVNNLNLFYIVQDDSVIAKSSEPDSSSSIGVVFFAYYLDEVDNCMGYLKKFPKNSNYYIVSSNPQLLVTYETQLRREERTNIHVILSEPRGRDVSAYLIGAKDAFQENDIVCCLHDKKTGQMGPIKGKDFAYHCFENVCRSEDYILNVVELFKKNHRLGLLVPPFIHSAEFYTLTGNEISTDLKEMEKLYNKFDCSIPFDEATIAPFGTMFWVRGKAFQKLTQYPWKYSDFPEEPIGYDGTILHGLERMYPMLVQQSGYYVGFLTFPSYAAGLYTNLNSMLRNINTTIFSSFGPSTFSTVLLHINELCAFYNSFQRSLAKKVYKKSRRVLSKMKQIFYSK